MADSAKHDQLLKTRVKLQLNCQFCTYHSIPFPLFSILLPNFATAQRWFHIGIIILSLASVVHSYNQKLPHLELFPDSIHSRTQGGRGSKRRLGWHSRRGPAPQPLLIPHRHQGLHHSKVRAALLQRGPHKLITTLKISHTTASAHPKLT